MREYLLIFDDAQRDRGAVTKALDRIDGVRDWVAFFDNAVYLASEDSAKDLSRAIHARLPGLRFVITDAGRRSGFLPRSLWDSFRAMRPAASSAA